MFGRGRTNVNEKLVVDGVHGICNPGMYMPWLACAYERSAVCMMIPEQEDELANKGRRPLPAFLRCPTLRLFFEKSRLAGVGSPTHAHHVAAYISSMLVY